MDRRTFLGAAAALTTLPDSRSQELVPSLGTDSSGLSREELPDWIDTDTERKEAVYAWAGDHVHRARTALWSRRDPETAKQELRTALNILEAETE